MGVLSLAFAGVSALATDGVDVAISGSGSPNQLVTGNSLTYTLLVTNRGSLAATAVHVTDSLPRRVTFSSYTATQGSCSNSAERVDCDLGTLAPGASATVRIIGVPTAPGAVTDVATVSLQETDADPSNNSVSINTTVVNPTRHLASADVLMFQDILAGTADPYPSRIFVSGLTASVFKVTVTLNNLNHSFPDDLDILLVGPNGKATMLMSDAGVDIGVTDVTLTFDDFAPTAIPDSQQLVTGTYRCANYNPGSSEVSWRTDSDMPPPAPASPYPTALSVFNGSNPNGFWSIYAADDLSENGGYIDGWSIDITPIDPIADLEVTQKHSPDPGSVGGTITYSINVTNRGPASVSAALLTNTIPAGFRFLLASVSQGSFTTNGIVRWDIGALANGAGATMALQLQPQIGGVFSNVVVAGSEMLDIVSANSVSVESTSVTPQAELTLTTLVSRNPALLDQPLTYTLLVTNLGPNTATGVKLTDVLPPSLLVVTASPSQGSCTNDNGVLTCNFGTMTNQARATVLLNCRPTAVGSITNQASVTSDVLDVNTANNTATVVGQVDPAADIVLSLSDSPDPVPLGSTLIYTITVTNRGPSTASNIFVSDLLPTEVRFVSAQASQGSCTNDPRGQVGCSLGQLPIGGRATVTIQTVPLVIGGIANSAIATSQPVDPNNGNNSSSAATTVMPTADLALNMSAVRDIIWQGDSFTFTIVVSNLGPSTATGVRLNDFIPPTITSFSAAPNQGSCVVQANSFSCSLGDVPNGGSATVIISALASVPGNVTNSANVVANEIDLISANNLTTASTTIIPKSGSFANTNLITIVDLAKAVPYPSTIQVSGLTAAVQRVRIIMNGLSHTYPDDMDILLTGPNAQGVVLMSDAGGDLRFTNLHVTVDDSGKTPFPDEAQIISDNYRPADYEPANGEFPAPAPAGPFGTTMSAFNGTDPNGTWSLYILDDNNKDRGAMSGGWVVEFSTRDPIADLQISSSITPNPVAVGSNAVLSVIVSNAGPAMASGIILTNALPSTMSLVGVTSSQGSCTNQSGLLLCNLGTLASRSNALVQITLLANQFGSNSNLASVAGTELDVNPANNKSITIISAENPPTIAQQPAAQNIFKGETAFFSVTASGTEPLTYQWLRNGNPVLDATNSTLTLSNVTSSASGNYRVRISNRVASILSAIARLVVFGPPGISEIEDQTIEEDSATGLIFFEIGDVETPAEALTVSGRSSNQALVPDANILFSGSGSNRMVQVIAAPDQFGTAVITVEVEDTDLGVITEDFLLTVLPINDLPTLLAIPDQVMNEDTTSAIPFSAYDIDQQYSLLSFTATSSDQRLIANSGFVITGEGTNRNLTVTPNPDQFGQATITVTVIDPSNSTASVSFALTVNPVNDPPLFDLIPDLVIDEDSGAHNVTVTGIAAGPTNEIQRLRLTATSSQPAIIPNPRVQYTSPETTGVIILQPATNAVGTATITVTLTDNQGQDAVLTRTFNVTVTPIDDPPIISDLANKSMQEDGTLGIPVVIGDPDGAVDSITLTGASSNQILLTDAGIVASGTGANRVVQITPQPNQVGNVTVTLTVTDTNGTSAIKAFVLTVNPVDDPPTLAQIADLTIPEDSGPHPIALTGIGTGGPDEVQALSITATSSNPSVISNLNVSYQSPNATGTLTITPVTNALGTAVITVTVTDGQLQFSRKFTVNVTSVGDVPTIANIGTQSAAEDTPMIVNVRIADIDTPAALLSLSATSSVPTLVANTNIFFEGNGTNRTMTIIPRSNQFGSATITVSVSDGVNTTSTPFTATFTAVNDPPTLDPIPDISVDDGVQFVVNLTGITSGAANEGDTVTISAVSSNATLVSVRSITQNPGSVTLRAGQNLSGSNTIAVTATDSGTGTNSFTRLFTVFVKLAANSNPGISDITDRTIAEDSSTPAIPFVISDGQTPAANLTLKGSSSNPALVPNTSIVFGGSGTNRNVTVTPLPNRTGSAVITIQVTDAGFGMAQDTFVLTVTNVNDLPLISDITDKTITEPQTSLSIPFTVSDLETAAGDLIVTASSANTALIPNSGLLLGGSGTNRALVVNAIPGQAGSSVITVQVNDGTTSRSDTFVFTVQGINHPPTIGAIPDQITAEDVPTQAIPFEINDSETVASALTVTATSSNTQLIPNENIALSGTDSNRFIIITPAPDQFGTALITVQITDPASSSAGTTFQINVTPINDVPSFDPIADVFVNQDTALHAIPLTGIRAGPTNENQVLLISATSSNPEIVPDPIATYTSADATGTLTFGTTPGASGTVVISVTLNDGQTTSNLFTRTFQVTVNGSPTVTGIHDYAIPEDSVGFSIDFLVTDDYSAPETLLVTASSSNSTLLPDAALSLTGTGINRTLHVTPITNLSGDTLITIVATDTNGLSSTSFFQVTVTSVNDLPQISGLTDQTIDEDHAMAPMEFLVSDLETAAENLTLSATSSNPTLVPAQSIVFGGTGSRRTVSLLPATNQFGSALITITVHDLNGGTASQSFTVTVNPINDPPFAVTIADQEYEENTIVGPIAFTIRDPESPATNLVVLATSSDQSLVPNGNISLGGTGSNRTITIHPINNRPGTVAINITVTDPQGLTSTGTFSLMISPIDDFPELFSFADQSMDEDQVLSVPFVVDDPDDDADTLLLGATSTNAALLPPGSITFGGSGTNRTLIIRPATNAFGISFISVVVSDPHGLSIGRSFVLTVRSVNDAPAFSPIPNQTTGEDRPFSVPLLIADSDTPLSGLTITASSGDQTLVPNTNLVVTVSGTTALLQITPATNQFGTNTITVTAQDPEGLSTSHTFTLRVFSINDLPQFVTRIADTTILEDTSITIPFTIGDIETPADIIVVGRTSYSPSLVPDGAIIFGGSGSNRTVTITPNANQNGVALIEIRIRDEAVERSTNLFHLTVLPVEDPPTMTPLSDWTIPEDGEVFAGFFVNDVDVPASSLIVTGRSSNTNLVSDEAFQFGGTDSARTLRLHPRPNAFGTSFITIMVQDTGGNVVSNTSLLTVVSVNDLPEISAIANVETSISEPVGPIPFVIGDLETSAQDLIVTAQCSNGLIPPSSIELGGTESNRTVRIVPTEGLFGFGVVTVRVQDADGGIAERSFEVVVNQTNGPPEIAQSPEGGTFSSGTRFQMRVIATGPGPLTYQWRKDGAALPQGTNATLVFTNLSRADTGIYEIIVSNADGSETSSPAVLQVLDAPRIRSLIRAGTSSEIKFDTTLGQHYTIEYRDDLGDAQWLVLQQLDGTGQITSITDSTATGPKRFYRIKAE